MFHHKLITAVTVLSCHFAEIPHLPKQFCLYRKMIGRSVLPILFLQQKKQDIQFSLPRRLSFQVKVIKVSLKESGHGLIRILTRLMLPFYLLTP